MDFSPRPTATMASGSPHTPASDVAPTDATTIAPRWLVRQRVRVAGDLLVPTPTVAPTDTNERVRQRFAEHPGIANLPVVLDGRPIGLINRVQFHNLMAKPYFPELFARKPCTSLMNATPVVIEVTAPVAEVTARIVGGGEQAMAEGFILTEAGRYRGTGQTLDLLSSLLTLQTEQNRLVTESIEYAARIQRALLQPSRQRLKARFGDDQWLLWRPRDIVGGDLYHIAETPDGVLIALFDCTGHGVPGAFMTLIASAGLETALDRQGPDAPAELLAAIHRHIQRTLDQHPNAGDADTTVGATAKRARHGDDGLDGLILRWYTKDRRVVWASAGRPLWRFRTTPDATGFAVESHRGDRLSAGYASTPHDARWREHALTLDPGDWVVLATDGLTDQIGGGQRRQAFGSQRAITRIRDLLCGPANEAPARLAAALDDWRGDEAVRDDISVLALRCA